MHWTAVVAQGQHGVREGGDEQPDGELTRPILQERLHDARRELSWFVPVICVLAGVAISVLTIGFDRWFAFEAVPRWMTGGPDAATACSTPRVCATARRQ